VRVSPLPVAVAVLGLALSPATLWAQGEEEAASPVPPPSEPVPAEPEPTAPEPAEPSDTPPTPVEPSEGPGGEAEAPAPEPVPAEEPPPTAPAPVPVPRQSSASVSIIDFAFQPSTTQVTVGASITWTNDGEEPHDATANNGEFATETLDSGESGSVSFDQEGTIPYFCSIHPSMTGTITVLASDDGGGTDTGSDDTGSDDTGSDVPGPTEEAAVASADAAGTDGDLPATGEETGLLAALGLILLTVGLQLFVAQRFSPR
jgi:plastocyanin